MPAEALLHTRTPLCMQAATQILEPIEERTAGVHQQPPVLRLGTTHVLACPACPPGADVSVDLGAGFCGGPVRDHRMESLHEIL